jgi:gluconolactonase
MKILILTALPWLAAAADFDLVNAAESRKLFPASAKVERLATGLAFTEGPVWMPAGFLVFSDIPANKLMKWDPRDGQVTVFRENSQNANGNTLDGAGSLVTAEHGGRRVSRTGTSGTAVTIVDAFEGRKLNSPNDAVVTADGAIWFTDPDYGLAGRPKEQPGNYVYRWANGKLTAMIKDFDKPNGLCFSPDERKLYVADSGAPKHIRVFNVTKDGSVDTGAVFAKIDKGGPDGIRCDQAGRVWSSSGDGAQIFAADGGLIARILLPEAAANLAFGGKNGRTLFLTARKSLYQVETLVRDAKKGNRR